jgi:phosphoserine aminotransferase
MLLSNLTIIFPSNCTPRLFRTYTQNIGTPCKRIICSTVPRLIFSIYLTKLVLEWIRDIGGVETLHQRNLTKSSLLYDLIDSSDGFYRCPVDKPFRSRMNIPFRIGAAPGDTELEKRFVAGAEARGMISLKGHR